MCFAALFFALARSAMEKSCASMWPDQLHADGY
jgi:hypothetical protein